MKELEKKLKMLGYERINDITWQKKHSLYFAIEMSVISDNFILNRIIPFDKYITSQSQIYLLQMAYDNMNEDLEILKKC